MDYLRGQQKSFLQTVQHIQQGTVHIREVTHKPHRSRTSMLCLDTNTGGGGQRVVLPKSLKDDLMMKSPSGGTITFDAYCRKKLYRN